MPFLKSFKRLFIGKRKKAKSIEECIEQLKTCEEDLLKRQEDLEEQIVACEEMRRKHAADKTLCLRASEKKQRLDKKLRLLNGLLGQVDTQMNKLSECQTLAVVRTADKDCRKALKKAKIKKNKVDNLRSVKSMVPEKHNRLKSSEPNVIRGYVFDDGLEDSEEGELNRIMEELRCWPEESSSNTSPIKNNVPE